MADTIKLKLVRSLIAQKPGLQAVARSLGLTRTGKTVVLPANPAVMGMVRKIRFMIEIIEK
jgi:large subunit ribosomal protein L30